MKLSQTISVCTRADGRPSGYDVSSFSDAGVRSNRARLSMENIILNIFLAWCSDRSTPRGTCFAKSACITDIIGSGRSAAVETTWRREVNSNSCYAFCRLEK
jgi:hypothetical protein